MAERVWDTLQSGEVAPAPPDQEAHVPDEIELIIESRTELSGMTQGLGDQMQDFCMVDLPTMDELAQASSADLFPGDGPAPPGNKWAVSIETHRQVVEASRQRRPRPVPALRAA